MRLFISIAAPPPIVEDLSSFAGRLLAAHSAPPIFDENRLTRGGAIRPPSSAWRKSPPSQYHLTLQFLGDSLTVHQCADVQSALGKFAASSPLHPFGAECLGAGAFPSPSRATVLWAGVKSEELEKLAAALSHALLPLGFSSSRFAGHISIARSKFAQDAKKLLALPSGQLGPDGAFLPFSAARWSPKEWPVGGFSLMESRTVLGARAHEQIRFYPLKQG